MSKLVMVIDDSPTVRKIVEVSLKREGFEVVSYGDGIEALRAVTTRQLARIPDLILLDLDLPKMSGYEFARRLKAKPPWDQIVIVILSKHDGMIDRFRTRLSGAHAHLSKPFTTKAIVEVVTNSLSHAHSPS